MTGDTMTDDLNVFQTFDINFLKFNLDTSNPFLNVQNRFFTSSPRLFFVSSASDKKEKRAREHFLCSLKFE